jgi:hypothetical protein
MQPKKLVATGLATAMLLVASVLGAVQLGQYPTFLGEATATGFTPKAYIVVGKGAAPQDVVGAIDLGADLQQLSYVTKTVTGVTTTQVEGLEKQIALAGHDSVNVAGGDGLPTTLQAFHFSGLKQDVFSFIGTSYRYHEEVALTTTTGQLVVDHGFSDSKVNGTMTFKIGTNNPINYYYKFDQSLTGTPSYSNPLSIQLAGKEFIIVGTSTSGLTALSGNIGTIDATTGLTYSGYTLYAVDGSSGEWAKIQIKDSTGTVVQTDILNKGDVRTYTIGGVTFKVKLIDVWASTITNTVTAKVAVGSEVDKTYPTAATVDSNYVYPGETDWYIYWNDTDTSGNITQGDAIVVFYHPTEAVYNKEGDKLYGPNKYFELAYTGLTGFDKYVTVTVSLISGKTIYATPTSTAAEATGLNGFEITSDVKGSLISGSTGYDKVYVLFNGTHVWSGYWDSVANKIVRLSTPTELTSANLNSTNIDFSVSYGGVGGVTDRIRFAFNNQTSDALDMIVSAADSDPVTWDFENVSAVGSGSSAPTFRLGSTAGSAEAGDVVVTYSGPTNVNIGDKSQDVISNTPIIVVAPSSNSASDKAVFKVPSDTVKVKVAFGKIGATTGGGVTYNEAAPLLQSIAKLDTDIMDYQGNIVDTGAVNNYHLVLVGGPCVNVLAWKLVQDGKLDSSYACGGSAWTPGTAYVIAIDNAFATGKIALLVAGATAADTKLATDVLSQGKIPATYTGSSAKITGTITSPTITPL